MTPASITEIEIRLLVEAIYQRWGHDFRDYSRASLKRRLQHAQRELGARNLSALQEKVLHEPEVFPRLLQYLTVPVSEMFRAPPYYGALREHVVPVLKTYPNPKVWIAGCSTGEEAYSMAILLLEEGLLERSIVYATDINHASLDKARQGGYSLEQMQGFTRNYQQAGGAGSFSDYYTAAYGRALLDKRLRDSITFADLSLATDTVFAETHLVAGRGGRGGGGRARQGRARGRGHD